MKDLYIYIGSAFVLTFILTVILGRLFIPMLKRLNLGQNIRDDGPAKHFKKTGTPTMGGVFFLTAVVLISLGFLFSDAELMGKTEGLVLLLVIMAFGIIGFLDDFIKIALRRSLGLRAKEKLLLQIALAMGFGIVVMMLGRGTSILVPFSGFFVENGLIYDLGILGFLVLAVLVIVGSSNAVNLTDGLDGLAAGSVFIALIPLIVISLMYDKEGVALVLAALAGGCLGFLVYNCHPAKVFMGDTGSLALGAAVGAAAVTIGYELFLVIIGGVFVIETLSVIMQVLYFKTTGRRIFLMSPLHHHFELKGLSETKVVMLFWGFSFVCALMGLVAMYNV